MGNEINPCRFAGVIQFEDKKGCMAHTSRGEGGFPVMREFREKIATHSATAPNLNDSMIVHIGKVWHLERPGASFKSCSVVFKNLCADKETADIIYQAYKDGARE